MNSKRLYHGLSVVLLSLVMGMQATAAQANIVTTNEIAAHDQTSKDRAKVQSFLDRTDVRARLKALGVDGLIAKNRVAALDDKEVHLLAKKIDSLPAGGNLSSLNDSDLIVLLLIGILLVLI
jgi:hypothetical protein